MYVFQKNMTKLKFLVILIIGKFQEEPLRKIDDFNYEVILDIENGYYNYKYLVSSNWYPDTNQILVVGESGKIFSDGEIGSGFFYHMI